MAVFPPGDAKEDWKILRALAELAGQVPPYNTLEQLRDRLEAANPLFRQQDVLQPAEWESFGADGAVGEGGFVPAIANYYMTDPISRASKTMAECTARLMGAAERTGTHG
jgi:NADH-quinone oxidoreductase subunit G